VPNRRARGGLDAIQELYHRACAHADAVARVDAFNFEVPIAPMYDPPQLAMQKVLDETVADSAEGRAYLQKLDALQAECTAALDAARADRSASVAIEEMWADTIGNLEPIVFIKCPPFDVNAIAPYTSNGASPASICVYDPARPDQPARVIYEEPRGGAHLRHELVVRCEDHLLCRQAGQCHQRGLGCLRDRGRRTRAQTFYPARSQPENEKRLGLGLESEFRRPGLEYGQQYQPRRVAER